MEIDDEEQAPSSVSFPLRNSVLSVLENAKTQKFLTTESTESHRGNFSCFRRKSRSRGTSGLLPKKITVMNP